MIFFEDIIELIEDVPDELQRRGGLIQDWERQASECKKHADVLTARLHNDHGLRDEEKANLYRQITELLGRARDVTAKKYEMADKCHQLLKKLSEKVNEWSYHCKLELEVDAPGSTVLVERNFINETVMAATAAANVRSQGFRVPEDRPLPPQRDHRGSSSISRESTPMYGTSSRGSYERRATRDSSISSSRASSTTPYDNQQSAAVQQLQRERKRKRDRDRAREKQLREYEKAQLQQQPAVAAAGRVGSAGVPAGALSLKDPMSSYMRKKKEREREERKLREVSRSRLLHAVGGAAAAAAAAAASRGGSAVAPLPTSAGYAPVHANREQRTTSQQRVIKPEPLDDGYEQQQQMPSSQQYHHQQQQQHLSARRPGPGRPSNASRVQANNSLPHGPPPPSSMVRREELQPERREEPEEMMNGGMSDPDNDDDLLKFLEDEMPGGIADHDDLHLGLEGENLFDMDAFGANLGRELEKIQAQRPPSPLGQNIYGYLNAPSKSSADSGGSSRYHKSTNKAESKRQQAAQLQQQQLQFVTFGAGESLHGRQRKLTARATDHAIDLDTRERRRRQKEEEVANGDYLGGRSRDVSLVGDSMGGGADAGGEEDVDNTPYCYCRQPSDGEMVGCDGKRCRYGGWFHLQCLGMLAPPTIDKWFCKDCERYR